MAACALGRTPRQAPFADCHLLFFTRWPLPLLLWWLLWSCLLTARVLGVSRLSLTKMVTSFMALLDDKGGFFDSIIIPNGFFLY